MHGRPRCSPLSQESLATPRVILSIHEYPMGGVGACEVRSLPDPAFGDGDGRGETGRVLAGKVRRARQGKAGATRADARSTLPLSLLSSLSLNLLHLLTLNIPPHHTTPPQTHPASISETHKPAHGHPPSLQPPTSRSHLHRH
ncbi:hypothetical protein EJ06DRAFT_1039 [Trichodelitschia bisporula]|uniref:Uncharacterized protein n=1 Tax=Trichodelitschia bisporula TaxID=703511 RepID=A0A6G1IA45_9PEZI|nr:hypothetical protein EJ06DRAFT_1039 [Trichodelitschia bisporula]